MSISCLTTYIFGFGGNLAGKMMLMKRDGWYPAGCNIEISSFKNGLSASFSFCKNVWDGKYFAISKDGFKTRSECMNFINKQVGEAILKFPETQFLLRNEIGEVYIFDIKKRDWIIAPS